MRISMTDTAAMKCALFTSERQERIRFLRAWTPAPTLKSVYEADEKLYGELVEYVRKSTPFADEECVRQALEAAGFEEAEKMLARSETMSFKQSEKERQETLSWLSDFIATRYTEGYFEDEEYREICKVMDFIGNEIAKGVRRRNYGRD